MQFAAHIRLADALDAVPSAHLAKLSKKLGRELATTLAERANVARRLDRLPNGAVDLLAELTGGDGHELELFQSEGQDERTLLNAGFVLPVEREGLPSHVIPFEVRAAIFPVVGPPNAPLAVHLTTWEPEELEELAGLHNAELRADPYDDAMSAAIELAETMLEPERVADLFESLTSAAKRLLHWVCEANVEVRPDEIAARSARFAELAGEPSGTAERVLVRLGILHEASSAGLDWIVVPVDLYLALEPVVEEATAARCRELYAKLRDGAHPAFRDTFPRGANGDALLSARRIVARAAAGDTASVGRDRLTAVLQVMRILESSGGVAELAAAHLDSATADRFAQQCLRTWVDSIDDEFTRVLMAPFGGDIGALADAIFGDPAPEDMFIGAWATFLARLRGELLMILSVLQPGYWYSLPALAALFAAHYRAATWEYADAWLFAMDSGVGEMPMRGVEVSQAEETNAEIALGALIDALLAPLGACELDPTRAFFTVNPEALRVFHDADPDFDRMWVAVETIVEDDIDFWLPAPSDWGARIAGVAPLAWTGERELELVGSSHTFDIVRLAAWADLRAELSGLVFEFTGASVDRGLQSGLDAADLLLWLTTRTERPLPSDLRALFPLSTCDADADDAGPAAERAVLRVLDGLEQWSGNPPAPLLEELRAWGPAAIGPVLSAASELVDARRWDEPALVPLIVLLGELGTTRAVTVLARALGLSGVESVEGSASTALARIGPASFDPIRHIAENPTSDPDRRLAASGALSSLAVLWPQTADAVVNVLAGLVGLAEDLPEDVPTLLAMFIAETGHQRADEILHSIQEQGLWFDAVSTFDEALWVAGVAPSVWGHPGFAAPLARAFPPSVAAARAHDDDDDDSDDSGESTPVRRR